MTQQPRMRRDEEIEFHTPGPRAQVFPYVVLAAGRATARRDDPFIGRRFSQHLLILTLDGLGRVEVGDRGFDCPPGSLAWLDTSAAYAHGCPAQSGHWSYIWVGLRGTGLEGVFELLRERGSPVQPISDPDRLAVRFAAILARLQHPTGTLEPDNSADIAAVIAAIAAARLPDELANGAQHSPLDQVAKAVRGDLTRPWQIQDLGAIAGLSASQLHRRFLDWAGTSPMDWVRRERVSAAKRLLVQTEATVGDIAARVGFPDPYHFSRVFRQITGQSPSAFRVASDPDDGLAP